MIKIFEYRLDYTDHQEHIIIDIPIPATILSVIEQDNVVVIYALADNEKSTTPVDFLVIGTGFVIRDNIDAYKFIGTVKSDNGKYIWHIFYRYIEIFTRDDYKLPDASLEHLKDMSTDKRIDVAMT